MTAQSGQDLLIKVDMNGSGDYQTIAGLRASKIAFNAQSVNASNMSSPGRWRELLDRAGIRSATISGSGVFIDAASDARVQSLFFEGTHPAIQFVIPDFGSISGKFQITSLEYAGNYDGEVNYDLAFASAGELMFAPEVAEA